MPSTHLIGVLSDTHGLLRPEALEALQGVEAIIHAGDVGDPDILDQLAKIAPVHAVRGNVDTAPWASDLPQTEVVQIGSVNLYVLHDRDTLDLDPKTADFHAVIFGHSHRLLIENQNGVLFLNPGSAGHQRFDLPVTLVQLRISGTKIDCDPITLNV